MYKSFDEEKFKKAIDGKDYEYLKTCVISAIRNNPAFEPDSEGQHCEARRAMSQLLKLCPDILEEYQLQDGESEFNAKNSFEWNKEYFIRQTILFGRNFCRERYKRLEVIGQAITPINFPEPQGQTTESAAENHTKDVSPKIKMPQKKKKLILILAAVLLLAALAGIIVEIILLK